MPPKNDSNAADQAEQVKLYSVRLVKPARINGTAYEAGETVEVDETVGRQLERAGALELPEANGPSKTAEAGNQA